MVLRKSFYIRWSAGRSPRVHEVNPGRDPSQLVYIYIRNRSTLHQLRGSNYQPSLIIIGKSHSLGKIELYFLIIDSQC